MKFDILEKFDTVDTSELTIINGGLDAARCIVGTLGSTILGGAGFGPGGAIVGFLGGTGAFCYDTVSWGINEALFYICN